MQFILDDLGAAPLIWMKSLPFDLQLTPDLYLCHGTPKSDLIYLLEDVSTGAALVREDNEIQALLGEQTSRIVCCGHTHTPRLVKLDSGTTILNPGSVGLQAYTDEEPVVHSMENYTDKACYAIVEMNQNDFTVEQRRVNYDVASAVKDCAES